MVLYPPEECSPHTKKFRTKNTPNTIDGNAIAVSTVFVFQSTPLNILYVREPKYPAKIPMNTKRRSIAVSKPPRFAGERNPRHAQINKMKEHAINCAPVPTQTEREY